MNVLRAGVRNKLQTKRGGQTVDIVDLNLYGEWRAQRQGGQTTFSDVYSELSAQPLSWLTLSFDSRVAQDGKLKEANSTITFLNQNKWSSIFHFFVHICKYSVFDSFDMLPTL
jgi:hypothetical protein